MNNSTGPEPDRGQAMPDILDIQVSLTCLAVVSYVVAFVGNCTVIQIVRTRRHMRSTTNILICSMSSADILMTFVFPYLVKHYYVGSQWFGGIMGTITCKLLHSSQMISIFCSVYTLLVISVDRFLGVMKPMKKLFTKKMTKWSVLVVWSASIIFSLPLVIVAKVMRRNGRYVCTECWDNLSMTSREHTLAFVCLTYVLPLVFISIAYGISGYKLWGSRPPGKPDNSVTRRCHRSLRATRRQATKMFITVVVLFALCWLPLHVREIIRMEAPGVSHAIPLKLDLVLPWFGFCHSCINPIIYIMFSAKFRHEFKRTLCICLPDSQFDALLIPNSQTNATRFNCTTGNGAKNLLKKETCV